MCVNPGPRAGEPVEPVTEKESEYEKQLVGPTWHEVKSAEELTALLQELDQGVGQDERPDL